MELHEQRQLLEQRLRGKFRNHAVLYSKYTPQIPKAVDREYHRLVNAYIGVLKDALDQELPALKAVYRREWRAAAEEQRFDSATDLMLSLAEIPWAKRQLWDSDVAEKDGRYYLYFCAKDAADVFHLGVAVAARPEGP